MNQLARRNLVGCLAAVLALAVAGKAIAAERTVFGEEFTATWCVYCPPVGECMSAMLDANPGRYAFVQYHGDDIYQINPFFTNRATFYGLQGYPTTWMDGMVERVGQYPDNQYLLDFANRRSVQTDVTIQMWAEEIGANQYRVTARVGVEAGGQARTMRLRIHQLLDHFPAGSHYRNCLIQTAMEQITVQPGETVDSVQTFTLANQSANPNRLDDVRFLAYGQAVTGSAPALVYQSSMIAHPFPAPPNEGIPGDLNGDSHVDLTDLATLLSNFGITSGATLAQGDTDEDGDVDLSDLATVLANFGS